MDNSDLRQLGDAIRAARLERGLTLRQLATRAGLHPSMLTRMETALQTPRAEVLGKIAIALEVDVEDFYALAGFTSPQQLPSLPTYLRTKYNLPPEDAARFEELMREVTGGSDTSTSPEGTRRDGDNDS